MPLKKTKVGVLYHRYLPGYSAERFAIDAEELGFDSLWVSENTFSRVPKADPFVVLGIFAAVTNRPLIGTAVVRLPLRSPAAMAKACAYVDQLSNGRLIFGIGVGGDFPEEFTAAGIPFIERGARTDECMDILKALWKNEETTFHGRFYQFDKAIQYPKPIQAGGPPLWVGGRGDPALRRTIRYGHGIFPLFITPQHYREACSRLEELATETKRDPTEITRALTVFLSIGKTRQAALRMMGESIGVDYNLREDQVERLNVAGTSSEVTEQLEAYIEAGVEHFAIAFGCPYNEVATQLETLGSEVLPHLSR